MNDPISSSIVRLAGLLLLGFLFVALGTFYWGFMRSEELSARPDNLRRIGFDRRIARGRILDRSGRSLAETVAEAGGDAEDGREAGARMRVYPYPSAAPVVGFQTWRYGAGGNTRVTYGVGGAEAAYDVALRGDLGLSMRSLIASKVLHRPQTGHDVSLTLDAELQAFAAEQLGAREGAVVVIDVESGAVRALVSLPTFDPAVLDQGGSAADDPALPLFNRATQGLYSPGSTWKAVTLAAALDAGQIRLDDVVDDGETTEYFSGFGVSCNNNPEGTNRFDIAHAFGWSCNVTFARMGKSLGAATFSEYGRRFGLEAAPPFAIPVAEASLSADDLFGETELVSAAFGQGEILVTPLHMALIAAGVAGDGDLPVPYLLEEVKGVRWNAIADERGHWKKGVPARTAAKVREAMVVSARDGWARSAARGVNTSLGGKTGTAQLDGLQAPHAWFIGFAPAESPRVAIAVLVVNGGQGGDVAAPIAGRVLDKAMSLEP